MTDFKPMLAKDAVLEKLRFPLIGQIKYDGIRAVVRDGRLVTRTLKEVPNREVFEALSRSEFEGLDGEIIVGSPEAPGCMQATSSFVMAPNRTGADWHFYVFDDFSDPTLPYTERAARLESRYEDLGMQDISAGPLPLRLVPSYPLADADALEAFEAEALAEGHEGVMVRDPAGDYKFGRSYPKDGRLLKIKRFIDFEAEVIGVYERMHNANEAKTNLLGRTERSTAKDGLVPMGDLGGLVLRALNGPCEGIEFRCGTGFSAGDRKFLWDEYVALAPIELSTLIGKTAKIKSFPVGVKDKPRFPVWLGWRDLEVDG